jgi:hypothetical protein
MNLKRKWKIQRRNILLILRKRLCCSNKKAHN